MRDNNKALQLTPEQQARAVAAYRQSGDAAHAMRAAGVELGVPWVEQKRNSGGMVEILASDLAGDVSLEDVESRAVDDGLYEAVDQDLPPTVEQDLESFDMGERLLAEARAQIPPRDFAVFLAVKVDGLPFRKVAREFNISYRQVWQIVDRVSNSLERIIHEVAE